MAKLVVAKGGFQRHMLTFSSFLDLAELMTTSAGLMQSLQVPQVRCQHTPRNKHLEILSGCHALAFALRRTKHLCTCFQSRSWTVLQQLLSLSKASLGNACARTNFQISKQGFDHGLAGRIVRFGRVLHPRRLPSQRCLTAHSSPACSSDKAHSYMHLYVYIYIYIL